MSEYLLERSRIVGQVLDVQTNHFVYNFVSIEVILL